MNSDNMDQNGKCMAAGQKHQAEDKVKVETDSLSSRTEPERKGDDEISTEEEIKVDDGETVLKPFRMISGEFWRKKCVEPVQSAIQFFQGAFRRTRAALEKTSFTSVFDPLNECPSCRNKGPAYVICPVCKCHMPELGDTSCAKCQDTKTRVFMCLKYHDRPPLLKICPCSECRHESFGPRSLSEQKDGNGKRVVGRRRYNFRRARRANKPYFIRKHRDSSTSNKGQQNRN